MFGGQQIEPAFLRSFQAVHSAVVRDMLALELRTLQPEDKNPSARIFSMAMLDNPIHVAVYGAAGALERLALERRFRAMLDDQPGETIVAAIEGEIVGVCRWYSCHGGWVIAEEIQRLIDSKPGDLSTIEQRDRYWRGVWASYDPSEPHSHLGPIAVRKDDQGRGIGKAMMDHYCRILDESGQASYLEADKEENVRFYQRFGFEVLHEVNILDVINTMMWRKDQSG